MANDFKRNHGKCCLKTIGKDRSNSSTRVLTTLTITSKTLFSVQNCNHSNWIITRNANQNPLTSSRYTCKEMIKFEGALKPGLPCRSAKRLAFCFVISLQAFSKVCFAYIQHSLMRADRGIGKNSASDVTSLQSSSGGVIFMLSRIEFQIVSLALLMSAH